MGLSNMHLHLGLVSQLEQSSPLHFHPVVYPTPSPQPSPFASPFPITFVAKLKYVIQ